MLGWTSLVLGILLVLVSLGANRDLVGAVTVVVAGLYLATAGASTALATVRCGPDGLRYRYFRLVQVPITEIRSVTVEPGSRGFYPRLRIYVWRNTGKPVKLTALQVALGDRGRERLEVHALSMATVFGVPPPVTGDDEWAEGWSPSPAQGDDEEPSPTV